MATQCYKMHVTRSLKCYLFLKTCINGDIFVHQTRCACWWWFVIKYNAVFISTMPLFNYHMLRKEETVLFNNTLNTFYIWLYAVDIRLMTAQITRGSLCTRTLLLFVCCILGVLGLFSFFYFLYWWGCIWFDDEASCSKCLCLFSAEKSHADNDGRRLRPAVWAGGHDQGPGGGEQVSALSSQVLPNSG